MDLPLPATTDLFERTLECERTRLVRLCAYLSGDGDAAEDLAQETMLVAWRNRHKLYAPDLHWQWLAGIAANVCRAWLRAHGRELRRRVAPGVEADGVEVVAQLPDDFDVAVDLERHELEELLDRALALLPAATRDVLVARYVAAMPHAEIATRLGISDKAVSMRISRGKLLLKALLTTTLRDDALAHGLLTAETDGWQTTRIWCIACGQQQLRAHLPPPPGTLLFRCPGCNPEPDVFSSGFPLANTHYQQLLGGLTRPKSMLNRTAAWHHEYFARAIAVRVVPCTNCGRTAELHQATRADVPVLPVNQILFVHCPVCGAIVSQSFSGFVTTFPQVQRFWQMHPRLHTHPPRELDVGGQPALLTRFESVTDAAWLEIVIARDSLRLLDVQSSAAAAGGAA